MTHLRLDRVEVRVRVDSFKLLIRKRLDRQRLQIQKLCVRRVVLRQYQVLKRNWLNSFCTEPPVADGSHVVLRGQRLEDRDCERERLVSLSLDVRTHVLCVKLVPGRWWVVVGGWVVVCTHVSVSE